MRAILSLSGGLDSTALLLHLIHKGYDIHTISYYYGQKNKVELDGLARILHYLEYQQYTIENQRVDLSSVFGTFNSSLTSSNIDVPTGTTDENKMKMNFVPNRNAIFSSVLYGFAVSIAKDSDTPVDVCLGVHAGDGNIIPPDDISSAGAASTTTRSARGFSLRAILLFLLINWLYFYLL